MVRRCSRRPTIASSRCSTATPYAPDHVLGVLPPQYGVATVELVAVNAAMTGCTPTAFPLVIAALEAMLVPEWNAFGLTTTTSSVFAMLLVNGPGRDAAEIDYRAGCMGGAAGRGSMTVGRSVSLCLRNIGGQRAGETSRTVFGQPGRFGLCFGEWEERSPWPSLATRRGFAAGDDVVTAHGGKGTFPLADIHNDDPRDLLLLIAKSIAFPLSNMFLSGNPGNGEVVVAINPMWAERFGTAFPDDRGLPGVPLGARLAAPVALARGEPTDPAREGAGRRRRASSTRRVAGADRALRVRGPRQPARRRPPELR